MSTQELFAALQRLLTCPRPLPRTAIAVAGMLMLTPATAFAYIDPGTGSFVIQGIIAAVVGAGVFFKLFWGRIKTAITGKSPEPDDDVDE